MCCRFREKREFCQILMKIVHPNFTHLLTTVSPKKWMKFLTQQNAHGGKQTYLVTRGTNKQKHRMLYCSTCPQALIFRFDTQQHHVYHVLVLLARIVHLQYLKDDWNTFDIYI